MSCRMETEMLTNTQVKILKVISENVGEPIHLIASDYSDSLNISKKEMLFIIKELEESGYLETSNKDYFLTDIGVLYLEILDNVINFRSGKIATIETDPEIVNIVWQWADAVKQESWEIRALISIQYVRIELEFMYSEDEFNKHPFIKKLFEMCQTLEEHGYDYAFLMAPDTD